MAYLHDLLLLGRVVDLLHVPVALMRGGRAMLVDFRRVWVELVEGSVELGPDDSDEFGYHFLLPGYHLSLFSYHFVLPGYYFFLPLLCFC